jgi:hypothetical protein
MDLRVSEAGADVAQTDRWGTWFGSVDLVHVRNGRERLTQPVTVRNQQFAKVDGPLEAGISRPQAAQRSNVAWIADPSESSSGPALYEVRAVFQSISKGSPTRWAVKLAKPVDSRRPNDLALA